MWSDVSCGSGGIAVVGNFFCADIADIGTTVVGIEASDITLAAPGYAKVLVALALAASR